MSGCLDNGCVCLGAMVPDLSEYRTMIASYSAGICFTVGWWLFIDAIVVGNVSWLFIIPCIVSTVGLFMINAISTAQMDADYSEGPITGWVARVWLMIGFIMGFAGLISSGWIMFQCFIYNSGETHKGFGVSLFMANLSLLVSSLIFKFGRMESDYAYSSV
eukprot:Nk52_evm10s1073 gene=Nk52_evmTU10s1073